MVHSTLPAIPWHLGLEPFRALVLLSLSAGELLIEKRENRRGRGHASAEDSVGTGFPTWWLVLPECCQYQFLKFYLNSLTLFSFDKSFPPYFCGSQLYKILTSCTIILLWVSTVLYYTVVLFDTILFCPLLWPQHQKQLSSASACWRCGTSFTVSSVVMTCRSF